MFVASFFAALASTSFVAAQQQTIVVGGPGGQPLYNPSNVNAKNGSIVTFQFSGSPGNHSVTQSTLNAPCTPVANGFDSGWVAFNGDLAQAPTWNITITDDSTPIWFYCKQLLQTPHCNSDMVGVINIGAKSFASFTANAASASPVGQGQGGLSGLGAFATALPDLQAAGSAASLFTGAAASATAPPSGSTPPAGSGPSSASSSPSSTAPPSGALATRASGFTIAIAALFGIVLV